MIDRRSVVKLGAGSLAAALVYGPGRVFAAMPARSEAQVWRAVFDERFDEGLAFAEAMASRGVVTLPLRQDVAKIWYEDLRTSLRQCRAPIVGLTDRATLFCLEELARDVGMRVSFRVDHLVRANGLVKHEATGPAVVIEATRNLEGRPGFGRAMAELACGCQVSGPWELAAQKRTGPFSPDATTALVSWRFV